MSMSKLGRDRSHPLIRAMEATLMRLNMKEMKGLLR